MDIEDRHRLMLHLVHIETLGYGMPVLNTDKIVEDLREAGPEDKDLQNKLSDIILLGKLKNALRQMEQIVPDWSDYMSPTEIETLPPEMLQ